MPKVVIKGDVGSHGGSMLEGGSDTDTGKYICRLGDLYNCPKHGPNPIVSGTSSGFISDGKEVALDGAVTQCGATITASGTDEVI